MNKYSKGNVVWVRLEDNSWWPGYITKEQNEGNKAFMVEYIGRKRKNMTLIKDLAPFYGYFKKFGKDRRGLLGKAINSAYKIFKGKISYEGKVFSNIRRV